MIFRHLKMTGFKSFAEQTALDIEQGLTGIVGPNGCGKSNIVEALRWVMGESNARQMRGTELDDIIFAGTENRASRDIAEISLSLDNSQRRAPVDFNKTDDIEITRKVERGKGSSYYLNGRPVRAKDVQLLFADTATGSRSAGMVSQGRIGAIVGAKPEDRRTLLEEAANIKGLHQRRHEAELRLKNAETNLERLADIAAQLDEQRAQLAKQARQAARYKSVADRIRKAESALFLRRWKDASDEDAKAQSALQQTLLKSADMAAKVADAEKEHLAASQILPPLIARESEAAAEYQRYKLALEECDRESSRVRNAITQLSSQMTQIETDREREHNLQNDAKRALQELADEKQNLSKKVADAQPQMASREAELQEARQQSLDADEIYASAKASLASFESAKAQHQQRLTQLQGRIAAAEAGLSSLNIEALREKADKAASLFETAEATATTARAALEAIDSQFDQLQIDQQQASDDARTASAELASLSAQIDALSYVLSDSQTSDAPPVSDRLTVTDGLETALAALLSDDLNLAGDEDALGYWRSDMQSKSIEPPAMGEKLSDHVKGHPAIMTAIQGVSIVQDEQSALEAQKSLLPGQALVSQQGQLWRWDGLVRKPSDGAAERLRQKAKLDEMKSGFKAVQEAAQKAEGKADALKEERSAIDTKRGQARADLKTADRALLEATRDADATRIALESAHSRSADLEKALGDARSDFEEASSGLDISGDLSSLQQDEDKNRILAEDKRARLSEAMGQHASLQQELKAAEQRIEAIIAQENAWVNRLDSTDGRLAELAKRQSESEMRKMELEAQPDQLEAQKTQLGDHIDEAEAKRVAAADEVAKAQSAFREAETALRDAQRIATSAREDQIRAEGQKERSADQLASLRQRIEEQLNAAPAQLPALADIGEDEDMPALIQLEDRVSRLHRERDSIGPVNLRAEAEMAEIDSRLEEMHKERDDLTEAIAKLRSAIATLNKEGRARLLESFADVNRYFKELFTTLFGGGQAELQLTESPDPLEAGLEILASPPGKKLQSLSLLSGGEQALTALAIIFAVFLTNPAPICVLDEVDAPLDDSNVSRFCDLLRDIVSRTQTRFLIVTHHRMTMAKMDRLYGVTMEQKGISRLVTVDLQTAESFRDSGIAS